jgi:hypothetical protein
VKRNGSCALRKPKGAVPPRTASLSNRLWPYLTEAEEQAALDTR